MMVFDTQLWPLLYAKGVFGWAVDFWKSAVKYLMSKICYEKLLWADNCGKAESYLVEITVNCGFFL
jgi:hypothetical protein